jgi:DNA-binding NarL/FixJ family response regulator
MTPTRILLADDHPVVQAGLQSRLAVHRPEWEVCALAATGLEAVAKAIALAPDIVVMDYKMPLLNGLEAAVEIRKRAPGIEVLLFSGAGSHLILQRMFHSSVRGCFLKSEAIEELIPALETIRRHHRFRSRGITDLCEAIAETGATLATLTRRETEILRLIAEGRSTKEIASKLGVSSKTIESHRTRLFRKLKIRSVVELVRYAIYHGLVEL